MTQSFSAGVPHWGKNLPITPSSVAASVSMGGGAKGERKIFGGQKCIKDPRSEQNFVISMLKLSNLG